MRVSAIKEDSMNIDSKILQQPLITKLDQFKEYDSVIVKHNQSLVDELKSEQEAFLKKILKNPSNIQLLYRAS